MHALYSMEALNNISLDTSVLFQCALYAFSDNRYYVLIHFLFEEPYMNHAYTCHGHARKLRAKYGCPA